MCVDLGLRLSYLEAQEPRGSAGVELTEKRLPSRVNPDAKWHKPPPPRVSKPKPFFEAAMGGEFPALPEPRKSAAMKAKKRRKELIDYDELEEFEADEVDETAEG